MSGRKFSVKRAEAMSSRFGHTVDPELLMPYFTLEQVFEAFRELGFPDTLHGELLEYCVSRRGSYLARLVENNQLIRVLFHGVEIYLETRGIGLKDETFFSADPERVARILAQPL